MDTITGDDLVAWVDEHREELRAQLTAAQYLAAKIQRLEDLIAGSEIRLSAEAPNLKQPV